MSENDQPGAAQGRCQTRVESADGKSFVTIIGQPAVQQALDRYAHAEARFLLAWGTGCANGKKDPAGDLTALGPDWLDQATRHDDDELQAAEFALEEALQREFELRSRLSRQSVTGRIEGVR